MATPAHIAYFLLGAAAAIGVVVDRRRLAAVLLRLRQSSRTSSHLTHQQPASPLTRSLQRAQWVDSPIRSIGAWLATVTAKQDNAVAHGEQPFETPTGHSRLATKVEKVEHEAALAV